ncbi:MAG: tripartite tricarboxylate transporter permease [Oscillibacter sp.]
MFFDGLAAACTPDTLLLIFLGVIVGIIFGSVPGLTAVMAIALFLPVTYQLSPANGITLLCALYIGAVSGGLISAILLNMPGTPASVATCFDGSPMAKNGQAFKALGAGTVFSFIGTIVGVGILVFLAPQVAKIAVKMGAQELFAISIFSLTLISGLTGKSVTKGLMSAILGFMFTTIGSAPIDSVSRYTFGITAFRSGFDTLTLLIGLYAINEILATATNRGSLINEKPLSFRRVGLFGITIKEFVGQIGNCLRSTMIGVGIGILPGIGGATSNILAYTVAQKSSKYPEKFGTGILDGVVASESANNGCIGGAMVPMLTLGIPGDAATAMLLGGFMVHGLQPGPLLFSTSGDLVYTIFGGMVIAACAMLLVQMMGLRLFANVLRVPKNYLLPILVVLCLIGAYGLNSRIFDVWSVLIFGGVGYAMVKLDMPLPPLILGFVLGENTELYLRRGLMYTHGSFLAFFKSPVAALFLGMSALSIVIMVWKNIQAHKKSQQI